MFLGRIQTEASFSTATPVIVNKRFSGTTKYATVSKLVMKTALVIVAAVGVYALIETGLMLSTAPFPVTSYSGSYAAAVDFGQLVLIPGMAALLSAIMYGPHRWFRRTLKIILLGSLGVPVFAILFAILVVGGCELLVRLHTRYEIPSFLLVALPVCLFALVVPFIMKGIRKAGDRGVQLEAARWLNERQSGVTPRERKWRIRGIRVASCIPVMIVLPTFLFFPQIVGIMSQVKAPHSGWLGNHRVTIPATWMITWRSESSVSGMAAQAIRLPPYFSGPNVPTLSSWAVGDGEIDPHERRWLEEIEAQNRVINRRAFSAGTERVTCVDYCPRWREVDSSMAYISCYGTLGLGAGFAGPRSHVAGFYKMLDGVTQIK